MRQSRLLVVAALAAGAFLIATGTLASAQTPELEVTDAGWDQLDTDEDTTFHAKIENTGDADRTENFRVNFSVLNEDFETEVLVKEDVPAQSAIEVTAGEVWSAAAGSYTLRAQLVFEDSLANATEGGEDNDVHERAFDVGPDLVAEKVTLQPSDPNDEDDVKFVAKITNTEDDNDDVPDTQAIEVTYRIEQDGTVITTRTGSTDGLRAKATKRVVSSNPWTGDPGTYTVVAEVDPDGDIPEVDPSNNVVEKTFDVDPTQPDLVVEAVQPANENPQAGEDTPIEATISNQGNANVTSNFDVRFRINGSTFGPDKTVDVNSMPDGVLTPGSSTSVTSQAWTTQSGHHDLTAVADPANVIDTESSEANNEKTTDLHVGPDLVVADIVWIPDPPAANAEVDFEPRIKNQGTAAVTQNTTVELRIPSQNVVRDAEIGPLEPGNSTQVHVGSWTPPDEEPGEETFDVEAEVDINDEAEEIDDNNNLKTETMTVTDPLPDLVTTKIETDPASPEDGDETTFTATIENQGPSSVDEFDVDFVLNGEQLGETKTVASGPVEEVDGNGGTVEVTSDAWTADIGNHTITVQPDPDDGVDEVSEKNNNLTSQVLVGPDLHVEDITWTPSNPDADDTVTFRATVANAGSTTIQTAQTRLFIDGQAIGNATVDTLDPDDNTTVSVDWEASRGDHTVRAETDPDNNLTEARENNNARTESFSTTASADLQVTSIRWSDDPKAGDSLVFTAQVANTGTAAVQGSFDVRFRIAGTALGEATVDGLKVGQSVSVSSDSWTAKAGSHSIRANADADDVVTEGDEDNNANTRTVTVGSEPQPDEDEDVPDTPNLVVTEITLPEDPQIGDQVTFLATIENQGGQRAPASTVEFLVDDEDLSQHEIEVIDPGQSASVSSDSWEATEGEHTVAAIADALAEIDESDEDDNDRLETFLVGDVDRTQPGQAEVSLAGVGTAEAAQAGQAVRLVVNATNSGDADATETAVEFFVDGERIGTVTVDRIPAGQTAEVTGPFWNATEGEHTIVARSGAAQTESTVEVTPDDGAESIPAPGLAAVIAGLAAAATAARRRT